VFFNNPYILQKLPPQYQKWLLLFDPKETDKLPDRKECDDCIELKSAEENLRMGPIDQLTLEEARQFKEYLDKMIQQGKERLSSSPIGSPIMFVPKPNEKGSRLCFDYRHLHQNELNYKTPLPDLWYANL
jgi:hypothetical protein